MIKNAETRVRFLCRLHARSECRFCALPVLHRVFNCTQKAFYIPPDNGEIVRSRVTRLDSIRDDEAILEDENLLTPEESPTHDHNQWETIETMVINGNEPMPTFVPK